MQLPPIPPTTETVIVFPLDTSTQVYDSTFYHPTLTHGRSTKEEIQMVLVDIQTSRKHLVKSIERCAYVYCLCLIIAAIAFFVMAFDSKWALLDLGICILFFFLLSVVTVATCNNNKKQQKKAAEDVLINYKPEFARRGLNWVVPNGFPRWIELHKDYLGGNQPVYMLPANQQPQDYQGVPQQYVHPQQQFMNQNQYYPPAAHQV